MLLVVAIFYGVSRLPLGFLLNRLRYPGLFIAAVVILLPLTAGETVIWRWGWLSLRLEGLEAMGLVVCRFLSILTLGFILLGTTPFLKLIRAMRALRMPAILADMTLLSYRYLFEVADTLTTMQKAMGLRGFGQQQGWLRLRTKTLKQLASLTGSLLIRSYERSERVYKAMRLRGYGQLPQRLTDCQPMDFWSIALTGITLTIAISFFVAEIGLQP
jgi:cobalt/nickel transport system permease protein